MLMLLLPLALSLASFGLCYIVFEELALHQGEMIRCPAHVLVRMHVCWQFHAESSVSNRQIGMQLYHCSCEGSRAQEYQGTLKTGQVCCMVERLADSSSGEYVNMLNEEEEPLDTLTAGNLTATGTASTDAAPAASGEAGRTPWQPRVIRDRLGQLVREPTGPPPIVLEAEDYEDSDEWAAEQEESSQNLEEDEMVEPTRAEASLAEMDPNYRHISLAMSTAISEVLRRHGNTQETFHVLSVPPIDWLHTKGFKMVTVPLTKEMRRHPNLLKCSDGPRFAPPHADRSEMTDAEEAADEELAALRSELEDDTEGNGDHSTRMHSSTAPTSSMASGTATSSTMGPQRRYSPRTFMSRWSIEATDYLQLMLMSVGSTTIMDGEGQIRKRALRRAIERAHNSTDGYTWYKGRRLHHQQLCSGKFRQEQPKIQTQQTLKNQREARTLRMISWNTGGLHSARYNEVLVWLDAQASAGRPVDLLFLQETHWKQDYEYVATPVEGKALQYRVIHSAGDDKAGLMCMIRTGIVPDSRIRHHALLPGRLLHIRLMFPTPVDIMNTYQFAWNPNKAVGEGHDTKYKVDTLMRQRRRVWKQLEQWLRGTPHRHGCLIVGDLNTPVVSEPPVSGTGIVDNQRTQQQDQETFQEMLRSHHCSVLNSWSASGWKARTFIPPGPDDRKQGTQIDFFIARGVMDTAMSRQATPFDAPFVPTTGCRHRPLQAEFTLPRIRYHRDPSKTSAQQVRAHLRHPQQAIDMLGQIAADLDQAHEMDDLDQVLLRGWEIVKGQASTRQVPQDLQAHQVSTRDRVMYMWRLRADLRQLGNDYSEDAAGRTLKGIWDSWSKAAKLQRANRQLRKDCRQRKTLKIIDAVNSDNVFVAAKRFAPKQPRRRLQLRSKEGHLQSHEAEFEQICSYFRDLFKGPAPKQCPLPEQVTFTEEEVSQALGKLAAGKAMPSTSAPAAIWKLASAQVTPLLCKQFSAVLVAGATELPAEWSQSELVLLPKPGKSLTSPSQLRPINLLPLQAKVLGAMLAMRLQEYAQWFLWEVPQYAYLQGRSLGQALERVAGQCAAIRSKLQAQTCNPHAKKEGHRLTQVGGGCFLSLDISKAYDHVDWGDLTQALAAAKVPESLISLIMMIHREARIRIQHCGHECTIAMGRGLRQGCSLAPILWSIYSGWVLTKLHRPGLVDIPKCNTSYADDLFFGWTVSSGQEMATVYRAIRHILEGLGKQGLQLSLDKTVIVLGLKGPGAATCLKRYVVERAGMQGQFMKFQIGGEAAYVKIVKQHLYLGAQISFQKYEQATAKHRMGLAKGAYTRLAPVLKCRTVPLKLRLHLWQGTILPTLLHGLDCLGLLPTEAAQMMTVFYQQARAIAKSFSMYTHETNMQFAQRLKLASPLRRLLKAIDIRAKTDSDLSPSLRAGDVQLQWRHFVRGQLSEAQDALGTSAGPKPQQSCSLLKVQDIIPEVFTCSECGISYGTQAEALSNMNEDHSQADQTNGEHRQKYHKGGPKGVQGHRELPVEGGRVDGHGPSSQAAIQMLTTVVIRHESQHAIARQDTSYVLFVRTDVPDSPAKSTFAVAQQWQETKAKTPEKLRHPMRAILFQHVIKVTMEKFELMVASPSSRSTAVSLDWMSTDEQKVNGLKWDPEARKHVKDDHIQPLGIQEIREALQEILEYTSQNLTMMLEIGLRSVGGSGSLPATGGHATECIGPALSSHHGLMNLRLGNRGNHCYGNSALRGFIAAAVARGGMSTMFEGAMLGFIESLLQRTGIVFLWEQPFWAALTGEWELPSRQHDGVEFILFLLNRLPFTADHATATWQ
ncbi:unnamed protein product, partial [Symbiodinium microadriaticum]